MTPDDKLSAFFAEAVPPVRDLGFQAVVAQRIARRRAVATLLALVPWTIAAMAVCWAVGPLVAPFVFDLSQMLAPAVGILAVTGLGIFALIAAGRRLAPA